MVAPLVAGALLGAGAGYLQGQQKREAEARQRALAAQVALYSPWTKMTPQLPGDTSVTDSMLQGAMGGASFGLTNSDKLGAMMASNPEAAPQLSNIPQAAPNQMMQDRMGTGPQVPGAGGYAVSQNSPSFWDELYRKGPKRQSGYSNVG